LPPIVVLIGSGWVAGWDKVPPQHRPRPGIGPVELLLVVNWRLSRNSPYADTLYAPANMEFQLIFGALAGQGCRPIASLRSTAATTIWLTLSICRNGIGYKA
jgi:hypothetical protein